MLNKLKPSKHTNKIVSKNFPLFKIGSSSIQYITQFKYLGHVISNSVNDDGDIQREIRNMFIRTNILVRRFSKCSRSVKTALFKSYCICMYDVALWKFFKKGTMDRFHSCYNECVKAFFGCKRYDSLTKALMDTGIPSFNTIIR